MIEPVDSLQGGVFDVFESPPGSAVSPTGSTLMGESISSRQRTVTDCSVRPQAGHGPEGSPRRSAAGFADARAEARGQSTAWGIPRTRGPR